MLAVLQSERSKSRNLRRTLRWLDEPGDDASDIDGRRRDDVLQVRFRKANRATTAQPKGPNSNVEIVPSITERMR